MTLTPKERVGRGLDILAVGLRPFVELHMRASASGRDWVALLTARDELRLGRPVVHSVDDPQFVLRVLTEEWRAFGPDLTRVMRAMAQELRETRNQWAHRPEMSQADADRALDTMERLLLSTNAAIAARRVRDLRVGGAPSAQPGAPGPAAPGLPAEEPAAAGTPAERPAERVPARETGALVDEPPPPAPAEPVEPGPVLRPRPRAAMPPGHSRLTIESGPLDVALVVTDAVTYALAHNGISPLVALTVSNLGDRPITLTSLTVALESPLAEALAEPLALADVTIAPGETHEAPAATLRLTLHPLPFARLDEAVTGEVHLTATTVHGRHRAEHPIRVLARDQWWSTSIPESLAAFVQPRDRAVADLLSEASDLLATRTGDPSLQGYQAGYERVVAIAEAVYDAMRARRIRYVEPPPSFEGVGQKIRPPREVLVDRWGTCLDLTCTLAAAFEAAGLNPVIVSCVGHAFAGALLEDSQLAAVAVGERNHLVNLAESGLLIAVETTALTASDQPVTFEQARGATRRWFTDALPNVEYALDVRAAHRRVRPLPVVVEGEGGVVVEVERTAEVPPPHPRERREGTSADRKRPRLAARPEAPPMPARVAQWRNALLDLSFRNPLLNMRMGRSGVDLHVPAGSLGTLEDLVAAGESLRLVPHDQIDAIHRAAGARTAQEVDAAVLAAILAGERAVFVASTTAAYTARLRALARKARTIVEETGANNLFLALGSLTWEDAGREATAPLFLVPVTLKARHGQPFDLILEDGAVTQPNQCLLEKLRVAKGLEIPAFAEPDTDDAGIDLPVTLREIRAALLHAGLPYRVEETAHLGIFQFSTLQMWQDLGDNWPAFLTNPVVRHLVETPTDSFADPAPVPPPDPAAEATAYLPVPADGSQLEAVRWAAAGRSFVLEGPPGTGKSQTITNLIAHNVAEGRRVLFVAEKQAALDVVKRRLDAVGLGTFSLDLHGKSQTPSAVRAQLREALHARVDGNPATWEAQRAQYRSLVAHLRRYPEALHAVGPAGFSAWSARQVVLTLGGADDRADDRADDGDAVGGLRVSPGVVSGGAEPERLYAIARDLALSVPDLGAPLATHPWLVAGPARASLLGADVVAAALAELVAAQAAVNSAEAGTDPGVREIAAFCASPAALGAAAAWLDHVPGGTAPAPADARTLVGPSWGAHAEAARKALVDFRAAWASVIAQVAPRVLGADLDGMLQESRAADGRFLFKGRARRAVLDRLAPYLRQGATVAPRDLTGLLGRLVALRAAAADLDRYLAGVPAVRLPAGWNPLADEAESYYAWLIGGVAAAGDLARTVPGADAAAGDLLRRPGAVVAGGAPLARLAAAWTRWFGTLGSRDEDVERWRAGRPLAGALRASVAGWTLGTSPGGLLDLHRWGTVQRDLQVLADAGLGDFVEALRSGALSPFELEERVRLGVARAALDERLRSSGLDAFDERQRGREIQRFIASGEDVRRRLVAELPARIVAARSFSADRMIGTVGTLSRELARQRGGKSIRGLLAEYGSAIGELTPCLLMSPHSVARFFPPGALAVDLVVFDEASQIRVAESVGAMGRGSAVVVVGDSKQMPPTTFGGPGYSDEEPSDVDDVDSDAAVVPADAESILTEAVDSQVPRLWLSWHYRSQDETLIAFSNRYYYDGRLASFPGPPGGRPGTGVTWRRVDGHFARGSGRVNRVEAVAIVEEITRRLHEDAGASIGVVTFNAEQRDLILDLLEASHDQAVLDALAGGDDGLFVKNLENVQGDEREVILFSLAFSRDPATGVLPLNFGPLNRAGGERRLNVAITRAKRQVVLFSSFDPEDIALERTASVGLAHLRDYLMLAARGSDGVTTLKPRTVSDAHRDVVASALREAGLIVRTEVGLSDFRVDLAVAARDEGPWVAVLLDGPAWASRATVADREALPTAVLAGVMGWPRVERVWLPSWLTERDRVVTRIVAATAAGVQNDPADPPSGPPSPPAPPPAPVSAPAPPASPAPAPAPADDVVGAFRPAATTGHETQRDLLDRLADRRAAAIVRRVALDVIATESPIEEGRLARIVGNRFGFQRVQAKRAAEILRVVPAALRRQTPLGTYYWAEGTDPESFGSYRRTPSGANRPLTEVAPEEIANAMADLARLGRGIEPDELFRETSDIFDCRRLTPSVRTRLQGVLGWAVATGRLREDGGRIHEHARTDP